MNKEIAFKTLIEFRDVLNKIKCPYFIMGGTLLGFVREGNFIEHDDDIDIGVFIDDFPMDLCAELKKQGFNTEATMGEYNKGLEYRFKKNGVQIDIFFWYKESNYSWYGAWWKAGEMLKLKFDKFDLSELYIQEQKFNIPHNPEYWLKQIYGDDWKTPNSNWHWAASPKNIIEVPFDNKKEKKICLGMIVKNEEKIIKKCLEAAKQIIDYWIIIDTGSSDKTKEIIKETLADIPGELLERPWVNFGHNRTEVAKEVKLRSNCDYMLMVDSDEIINILHPIDKKLLIADYYDINEYDGFSYYFPFLFSNRYVWKSVGVTHEYWNCEASNLVKEYLNDIRIIHECNGSRRPEKGKNDLNLLIEGVNNEPNNARYTFYLAQTYRETGNIEKAIEYYYKRIKLGGWWEEIYYSRYMIIRCLAQSKGNFDKILEEAELASKLLPSGIEHIYEIVKYCRINSFFNVGFSIGNKYKSITIPGNQRLFVSPHIYNYAFYDELSICAYYSEDYQASFELCNLAIQGKPQANDLKRIIANREFSVKKLNHE
jgi:tetratricopeptide (TPR) repeat protein